MKKIYQFIGSLLLISGFIFLLIFNFIVTGTRGEDFSRDIFNFPIPHPPLWTSYIPYIGFLIGFIFEFFSLHGLIGIVISGVLFGIGGFLMSLGEKNLIH